MITYQIDENDLILDVGGEWEPFAKENGADSLSEDQVLGKPLFHFITGDEIVQLYRQLFRKVRAEGQTLSFTFRCDAPDCRRRMSMKIAPLLEDGLQVTTDIIAEEERPFIPLLDRHARHSKEMVVTCAICAKVKKDDGEWVDIEDLAEREGWLESEIVPALSHSFCPACLDSQLRLIDVPG